VPRDDIQEAIVDILSDVTGIGQVYGYERTAIDFSTIERVFYTNGLLHCWTVSRMRQRNERRASQEVEVHYVFRVRGYYQLDDAAQSEVTFQAIVDSVMDAFLSNYTINDTAELGGPMQLERFDTGILGGVAVHYVECTLEAQELISMFP
jgi:hypothetical protein